MYRACESKIRPSKRLELYIFQNFSGFYRHFCARRRVHSVVILGGVVKRLRRSIFFVFVAVVFLVWLGSLGVKLRQEKNPININILGGTVFGTKQEPSLGDPSLGQTGNPSLGQTGRFLLTSTVKSPFCSVCPWDGRGFVPGTIVPQRPSEKCLCVLCFLVF